MTRAAVIIPWFGNGGNDPYRLRAVGWVRALYVEQNYALVRRTYSLASKPARARNGLARDVGGDRILVFNDADSLCKPEQIREAVRLAAEAPGLVFAFTNYCRLSQKTTESLTSWRDAFDAPVEWEMYGSNSSGCVAISRESFLQVGGYDETWLDGYEDYDFAFRCAEMFGPNRRVEGDLIHLWHPRPAVEPENGRDRERFEKKWLAPR